MNSCCLLLKITPLFRSAVTCVGTCLLNAADFILVTIASTTSAVTIRSPSVPCQRQQMTTCSVLTVFTSHSTTSAALWPNQNSVPLPHCSDTEEWVEAGSTGLMIQRWSHPCWPSGTSDNDEDVLTLTAGLFSHVQSIKMWKDKHLSCVKLCKLFFSVRTIIYLQHWNRLNLKSGITLTDLCQYHLNYTERLLNHCHFYLKCLLLMGYNVQYLLVVLLFIQTSVLNTSYAVLLLCFVIITGEPSLFVHIANRNWVSGY